MMPAAADRGLAALGTVFLTRLLLKCCLKGSFVMANQRPFDKLSVAKVRQCLGRHSSCQAAEKVA